MIDEMNWMSTPSPPFAHECGIAMRNALNGDPILLSQLHTSNIYKFHTRDRLVPLLPQWVSHTPLASGICCAPSVSAPNSTGPRRHGLPRNTSHFKFNPKMIPLVLKTIKTANRLGHISLRAHLVR